VARLGETLRRRQEKRHFRGERGRSGNRFLGRGKPGRREQPAHESLSSRATLVEVSLTGLSFDYCSSPIVLGDQHEALAPGQRLPDTIEVCLASGERCLLHELTNRAGHTALVIGGLSAQVDRLAQLESSIRAQSGPPVIEATIMLTTRSDDERPCNHLTPAAAELLGISEITLLVIRPDGHVGLRADRDHLKALAAYHARLVSG